MQARVCRELPAQRRQPRCRRRCSRRVPPRPTPNFAAGAWPKDKALTFRWKAGRRAAGLGPGARCRGGADDATQLVDLAQPALRLPQRRRQQRGLHGLAAQLLQQQRHRLRPPEHAHATGACGSDPMARTCPWGTLRWCQKTSSIERLLRHPPGDAPRARPHRRPEPPLERGLHALGATTRSCRASRPADRRQAPAATPSAAATWPRCRSSTTRLTTRRTSRPATTWPPG